MTTARSGAARERVRVKWAPYDTCPRCRALPRMPCRELAYNPVRHSGRPHHDRPKLPEVTR